MRRTPRDILDRYHARHRVPQLACPVCMRRPLSFSSRLVPGVRLRSREAS